MKTVLSIFVFLLMLPAAQAEQVRVAVAANFLATAKALAPMFEKYYGHHLSISGASTGKLYAQIINGAPYDVLLAADQKHSLKLEQAGKVVEGSRFVYASGQIVLWSSGSIKIDANTLDHKTITRLAIANPSTAPYGRAAQQALQAMGLWQVLKSRSKLVQGESIAQAFQFVATGNAELGFVALSQVLNPANRNNRKHYWSVPKTYYAPIQQEAALLKHGQDNLAAKQFLQFLRGDEALRVIRSYGYY